MRVCNLCGHTGEDSEFSVRYDYHADGTKHKAINNTCRKCETERSYRYFKQTKETNPCYYYAAQLWKTLNQRCVNGLWANSPAVQKSPQMISYHNKGILLKLTKDELFKFWKDNEALVKEIISNGDKPTLDRINDNGHYSLDNIQILSLKHNIHKSRGYAEKPKSYNPEQKKIENARIYRKSQGEN